MKNITLVFTALAIAFILNSSFSVDKVPPQYMAGFEKEIADFSLKNVDNSTFSTADYPEAKGFIVIFTCNHCPFAKLYSERLNAMNTKYKPLNVPVIAINSMDSLVYEDETFALMRKRADTEGFNFPYLHDASQQIGKAFKAEHTPQAFVIWKIGDKWRIKYSGAIDDNGEEPEKATPFITNAVDELLRGKSVAKPQTESFGCAIFYRK